MPSGSRTRVHTHGHAHTPDTCARAHTRARRGSADAPSSFLRPEEGAACLHVRLPPTSHVSVAPAGTWTAGTLLVRGPVFFPQYLSYICHKVSRERAHRRPEGPPAPNTIPLSVASGTVLSCGFGHRSSPRVLVTI